MPPSYSTALGLYRCIARNDYGQHDLSIQFQRPSLPDPPSYVQAMNITHNSFALTWQPAFDGGSTLFYHLILTGNRTEERQTSSNSIRFTGALMKMIDFDRIDRYVFCSFFFLYRFTRKNTLLN